MDVYADRWKALKRTTNQKAVGSNPAGRAISRRRLQRELWSFLLCGLGAFSAFRRNLPVIDSGSKHLRRAYDLEVISERTYKRIFRLFSTQGWRTSEPGDQVPVEQPRIFELFVGQALAEKIITPVMASELLGALRKSPVPVGDAELIKASQQLYDSYLDDSELAVIDAEMLED